MGVWYTNLEAVKSALDIAETARNNAAVRRAIESASRSIDGFRPGAGRLRRRFYPELATRYFSTISTRPSWQLPLGRYELIEATSVVSGGTTIDPADYILKPVEGPPYNRIDLVQTAYSAWPGGSAQDGIAITGLWGYRNDEVAIGTLGAQLSDTAGSTTAVSWTTARFGTGDILRIDDERVIVTERTWVDSGQNLGGAGLTASVADRAVTVTTGSAYAADEVITIDTERMLVTAVTGNTLTVERAYDGTVLAAHTAGADIYALTGVQLDRGVLGTTAAAHNNGATVYRHVVPGLVGELALAEAANTLQQELGAYGRSTGPGEGGTVIDLAGLNNIRADAENAYRRPLTWLGV